MNRFIVTLLILICGVPAYSQIIIEETPAENYSERKFGPNHKHYLQLCYIFALPANPAEGKGSSVNHFQSTAFDISVRYKRRLNQHQSLLFDLAYFMQRFNIRQTANKSFPNNYQHQNEVLALNNLSLRLYHRLNIDKRRGNHLGKYIDLGAYFDPFVSSSHITKNEMADGSKLVVTHSKLPYTFPVSWGLTAGIGYSRIGVFCRYRISEMFKEEYMFSNPPSLHLGIHLCLF